MQNFDMKRFGVLARWTLTMDRRHHIMTLATWTMILTLMFLFYTCVVNFDNGTDGLRPYQVCGLMVIMMVGIILTMGPAFMFFSMKGRHDDLRLLMLPASNLEKYLVRYLNWVLMLPICAVALVCADVVQWLVNTMAGHEHTMFVMQWLVELPQHLRWLFGAESGGMDYLFLTLAVLTLYVHSLYSVGATLFRSHKYNWVMTSVLINIGLIFLGGTLIEWGQALFEGGDGTQSSTQTGAIIFNVPFLCLSVLNFWLSYRQFRRTQLIGRFVNL